MIRFIITSLAALAALLMASCSNEPTVQKYFVEKSGQKGFMAVDIAPSIIQTEKLKLTPEEKTAVNSLHHINVLVYKADSLNPGILDKEQASVKSLLKTDKYDQLIKFNSKEGSGSINTKGEGEHLEEFIIYLHQKDNGLGLVRVTGKDMTPANVMTIAGLISKGGLDMNQLKPLQQMMQGTQTQTQAPVTPVKP
ncbi:hypothetical protein AM493_08660 [Flavobacterium akiainvivens]|uniref:DUF4252 domain-containing protein n=1 Tax=Flavobacterium akiainvivens TaxID=1202724 RepID=A0A0M8MH36_9FLAO|nr:DUF4252 domain-containing protein [Flavobacterium akiainvivens]KOS06101.1 hypothetical protein AM493_08660 [Flavobacterium akiainvivens]SFQ54931.1 protein of unknown function [Flavobacterium akiainvivens]